MYVYIYIYIYVYAYVHIYTYMYIHMHICMYIYIYTYVYTYSDASERHERAFCRYPNSARGRPPSFEPRAPVSPGATENSSAENPAPRSARARPWPHAI